MFVCKAKMFFFWNFVSVVRFPFHLDVFLFCHLLLHLFKGFLHSRGLHVFSKGSFLHRTGLALIPFSRLVNESCFLYLPRLWLPDLKICFGVWKIEDCGNKVEAEEISNGVNTETIYQTQLRILHCISHCVSLNYRSTDICFLTSFYTQKHLS